MLYISKTNELNECNFNLIKQVHTLLCLIVVYIYFGKLTYVDFIQQKSTTLVFFFIEVISLLISFIGIICVLKKY